MEFLFSIALVKVSLSAYNECLGGSISVSGNNLRCTYTILPGAELASTKNLLETKGVLSFKFGRSPDPLAIHKRCLDYVANKSAVIIELVSLDGSETVCHLKTFQEYPERSSLGEGYVGYERKFFRLLK
ncbi:hypothetical protein MHBO_000864 [Bonamia ostreae]|uniref:Uncharacterized protein n=1 Tax=Bonamia ostreae TaxID=126728 RepID=A0ABV2AH17_9EUKA